jgi:hypothetical protein
LAVGEERGVKRTFLIGGAYDGQRLGFESQPPSSIVLNGEAYRLIEGRWSHYRHIAPFGRRRDVRFGDAAKLAFVEAIAAGANVERAAQAAGAAGTVYRHLNRDPHFAEAYAAARRLKREAVAA